MYSGLSRFSSISWELPKLTPEDRKSNNEQTGKALKGANGPWNKRATQAHPGGKAPWGRAHGSPAQEGANRFPDLDVRPASCHHPDPADRPSVRGGPGSGSMPDLKTVQQGPEPCATHKQNPSRSLLQFTQSFPRALKTNSRRQNTSF